jgi:hypothetical protein
VTRVWCCTCSKCERDWQPLAHFQARSFLWRTLCLCPHTAGRVQDLLHVDRIFYGPDRYRSTCTARKWVWGGHCIGRTNRALCMMRTNSLLGNELYFRAVLSALCTACADFGIFDVAGGQPSFSLSRLACIPCSLSVRHRHLLCADNSESSTSSQPQLAISHGSQHVLQSAPWTASQSASCVPAHVSQTLRAP